MGGYENIRFYVLILLFSNKFNILWEGFKTFMIYVSKKLINNKRRL